MKKIAVLFPGQGSQYINMGAELYQTDIVFKQIIDDCCQILDKDLFRIIGNKEFLMDPNNTQFVIASISYAYYHKFLTDYKIVPTLLAGHSLGEITALTAANVISLSDSLNILNTRGQLMNTAAKQHPGAMVAVLNMEKEFLRELCTSISNDCDETVEISNYNSSSQIVISGTINGIKILTEKIERNNGIVIQLKVSGAYHSSLMHSVQTEFYHYLKSYLFQAPMLNVLSSVIVQIHDGHNIDKILTDQLVKPVRWKEVIEYIVNSKIDVVVETGPKNTLCKLLNKEYPKLCCLSLEKVFKESMDISEYIY